MLPSSEIAIRKALSLLSVELSNSRIPGGKLSYERLRVAPDGLDATPNGPSGYSRRMRHFPILGSARVLPPGLSKRVEVAAPLLRYPAPTSVNLRDSLAFSSDSGRVAKNKGSCSRQS